jgi:hypothetical protein
MSLAQKAALETWAPITVISFWHLVLCRPQGNPLARLAGFPSVSDLLYFLPLGFCTLAILTDRNSGGWRAERDEELRQATEADWLTRTRDSRCAEPSKTRPPSFMPVTCAGGWRAERERERERQTEHTAIDGSCGHVTVDAKKCPKFGHVCLCRSL